MPGNIWADEIDEMMQWKNSESPLLLELDWLTELSWKGLVPCAAGVNSWK